MSAQHTPGPWKVASGPFGATVFVGEEENPRIVSDAAASDPENVANARLIAAAPDLLAALREARERMMGGSPAIRRLIERTDAAIAKAEGRQP